MHVNTTNTDRSLLCGQFMFDSLNNMLVLPQQAKSSVLKKCLMQAIHSAVNHPEDVLGEPFPSSKDFYLPTVTVCGETEIFAPCLCRCVWIKELKVSFFQEWNYLIKTMVLFGGKKCPDQSERLVTSLPCFCQMMLTWKYNSPRQTLGGALYWECLYRCFLT